MAAARGIAGSDSPEQQGCFLCLDDEVEWFVGMNNTGGPVDVWAVDGVDPSELRESPEGYFYLPRRIAPAALELVRRAGVADDVTGMRWAERGWVWNGFELLLMALTIPALYLVFAFPS
jgi:hypothetical protein